MEEKVLNKNKIGMLVLLVSIALYIAAAFGVITASSSGNGALLIISVVYLSIGWIVWPGLKVLKPQEALVLTLFGKYVGTLKDAGFYFVNPFCTAVNPAASTKLNRLGCTQLGFRLIRGDTDGRK